MPTRLWLLLVLGGCAAAPAARPASPPPLLRLFDEARFGGSDESLASLWKELGFDPPAARGPAATARVIAALRQRLHDAGSQRLLEADAALLGADLADLPGAALALREVAVGGDVDLSAAARLRLFSLCSSALLAASRAFGPEKAVVANRCLYAVSERDPAPYFTDDAAARPPDPPWTDLLAQARALIDAVAPDNALRPTAIGFAERESKAIREASSRMPPTIAVDGAPRLTAIPYDRTPLLTVLPKNVRVDAMAIADDDEDLIRQTLREALAEDRRGRVNVLAHAGVPWARIAWAARLCATAGAWFVDLGVASSVAIDGSPVARLGGIPVAAWTALGLGATPLVPRDVPRGMMYEPARARLSLTLIVDGKGARLSGARGEIAGTAADALRDVRRTYPEEAGLLVWADGVSYGEVVAEIAAARVLFPALAFAPGPPAGAVR